MTCAAACCRDPHHSAAIAPIPPPNTAGVLLAYPAKMNLCLKILLDFYINSPAIIEF
jgi:hypothetical protein